MEKESKVKKYLMFSLSLLLTLLFLGVSICLIYLTSTIHWFLSIIVAFICIILIAVLAWYSMKVWFMIRNIKVQEERYYQDVKHANLDKPFDKKYFDLLFEKDQYKYVLDVKNSPYKMQMYLKINESSPLFNYVLIDSESPLERIEFNNYIDKVLLVHDVPSSLFKTIIIVSSSKKDLSSLYLLNNPYNIMHNKYYCAYDSQSKQVYLGEDKELTSYELVVSCKDQLSFIFNSREKQ